jgi:RNA methyltransferase, TrmH family
VEKVTSRQNALVKRFRVLAQDPRAENDRILLDGAHLVEEALASGLALEAVAFSDSAAGGRLAALARRVGRDGARAIVMPDAIFDAASPVQQPSGVVAIAEFRAPTLDAALDVQPALLIILDGVQDPGNVGAIVRAAEGCGATGVIAGARSAHPFGWKALRGSMGSAFRLPVVARAKVSDAITRAKARGIRVLATVPRDGTPLADCDLRTPTAFVLGGEGAGLSDALLASADDRVTIPMKGPVESLNVAIAASLLLYEASRQRG